MLSVGWNRLLVLPVYPGLHVLRTDSLPLRV
jgi:hypothetical protein